MKQNMDKVRFSVLQNKIKIKKKILIGIIGIFLVIVAFAIYKISTFSLFEVNVKEVSKIKVPNKNFKIDIYYLPSNATSQDYIQVRNIEDGVENVIENFERYDCVVKIELKGDSILSLVLKDTSLNATKADTFLLILDKT